MFNEMVVSTDADYQRALEAAQALLLDAELDIRGETADGSDCRPGCRGGDLSKAQVPLETQEASTLLADLEGITSGPPCRNGLCLKRTGKQDFWNNASDTTEPTVLQMMSTNIGSRYGQYSGADVAAGSNPILQVGNKGTVTDAATNKRGGWYWIEVLPYDGGAANSKLTAGGNNNLALNMNPNVVYRITAVAHGRKEKSDGTPVTRVVLQQTYARQKLKD